MTLHPSFTKINEWKGGFLPARLAIPDGSAAFALRGLDEVVAPVRAAGAVITSCEVYTQPDHVSFTVSAGSRVSEYVFATVAAAAATTIFGGEIEDPQAGTTRGRGYAEDLLPMVIVKWPPTFFEDHPGEETFVDWP